MVGKKMFKCILCAHLRAGYEIFKKIIEKKYFKEIILFTYNCKENSKLIDFAKSINTPVYFGNLNLYIEKARNLNPDFLLSIYYRDIISPDVLSIIKIKSINLHPSLLPNHKGTFSAPWAIINGDKFTGITYHEMITSVDEGQILLQKKMKIESTDTAYSLYNKLVDLGIKSFDEMYKKVIINSYDGRKQKGEGSYHYRKIPYGGKINLRWNLNFIDHFIRAMYFPPYEGAVLQYNGEEYEFLDVNKFLEFCKKNNISLLDKNK